MVVKPAAPSSAAGQAKSGAATPAPGTAAPTNGKANPVVPAPPPKPPALSSVYTLSGTDFESLLSPAAWNCTARGNDCLEVYQGLSKLSLTPDNFEVASRTTATLTVPPPTAAPFVYLTNTTSKSKGKNVTTTKATLSTATAGASLLYTTDNTTPNPVLNTSTTVYNEPFPVTKPGMLQVMAVQPGDLAPALVKVLIVPDPDGKFVAFPQTPSAASQLAYKSCRFIWYTTRGEKVEWDLPIPQLTPAAVTASAVLNESDSTEITFSNVQVIASSAQYPITFTWDGNVLTTPAPVFKYDPAGQTVKILITSAMTAKPGHKELLLNGYTMASGTTTPEAVQIELPFDVTKR